MPQRRIGKSSPASAASPPIPARLGVYFGMEAEFWLNMQVHYDLVITREALAENLAAIQPLAAAA